MKTALVLGSAGFLGRRISKAAAERGYVINCIDPNHEKGGTYFEECEPGGPHDLVFHAAANLTKRNVFDRNHMGMDAFEDIELDYRVARYLEKYPPIERAVWLSSSAVDAHESENYAFVKYVGERFALNLAAHGVPVSILRPFGGYGPGQTLEYPMPAILRRAMKREDPLYVWGSTHTVRDWIFVDDLIHAIMLATEPQWPIGKPVEIGTGVATTFGHLARKIATAVGYHPQILANATMPIASHSRVAHTGVAEQLGFKAQITLDEGIERMVKENSISQTHHEVP